MYSNKNFIEGLKSELKQVEESIDVLESKRHKLGREQRDLEKDVGTYIFEKTLYIFISVLVIIVSIVLEGYAIAAPFAIVMAVNSYDIYTYNKDKEKSNSRLRKVRNEWHNLNKKAEDIKAKLNIKKDNSLQSLIAELTSELDLNSDNTIDVIQHENEFFNLLKSNQSIILEMEKSEGKDYTKQFVKLSNFLVEKEKNLQTIFKRISDIKEYENFEAFKSNLIDQIQFYNILRLNSLQMISSFIDDDRITFYMIYEKLDKLGVWNTNFENQFLIKIDLLNSNINRLISEIKDMSQSINNSISELIFITQENTDSVTNKLNQIGSKLDTSNLLSAINTYQNYKTNQRLK